MWQYASVEAHRLLRSLDSGSGINLVIFYIVNVSLNLITVKQLLLQCECTCVIVGMSACKLQLAASLTVGARVQAG